MKKFRIIICFELILLMLLFGIIAFFEAYTVRTCSSLAKFSQVTSSIAPKRSFVKTFIHIDTYKVEPYIIETEVEVTEVELLAKTVYGEARGCSKLQQSGVIWCILNRADAWGLSIEEVILAPNQFHGYNKNNPIDSDIVKLVEDVLIRWKIENELDGCSGRTLPKDYLYFFGDAGENWFTKEYQGNIIWDWSLGNPYL